MSTLIQQTKRLTSSIKILTTFVNSDNDALYIGTTDISLKGSHLPLVPVYIKNASVDLNRNDLIDFINKNDQAAYNFEGPYVNQHDDPDEQTAQDVLNELIIELTELRHIIYSE